MIRTTIRRLLYVGLTPLALAACGQAAGTPADAQEVPLYDNLGTYHYAISTNVPAAQQYFDQGLRLYYAFNHTEAIRAFNEAARLDPGCAICHWGAALSYGPNINLPMDSASGVAAFEALQRARALQAHASPKERALIEALSSRYIATPAEDRAALDSAWAHALKEVALRFPDDPEAATLYAEALMNLSPWNYWNRDGSPRAATTRELLGHLERVLSAQPDHPGANHLYIHAVEEVEPARAVPMAERLAALMPGAGHIVHMPGHIYIRVGRYRDAIRANEHAVHADESYIQDHNPAPGVYTVGYYPHNYDFLAFAASMIGRSRQALDAADRIRALVPDALLREPGMTLLQNHMTRHLQMRVRFGRWDEILATAPPADDLPHARGVWHYATGRAHLAQGRIGQAETELEALRSIVQDPALAGLSVEFNLASDVLGIGVDVLAGTIAAARGDHDRAIALLSSARTKEDALVYGEPPEWSLPVRHELGAVLLEAGRPADAEAVYRQDLARFPANGWSLRGLALSLRAQGRAAEAKDVERQLAEAWHDADIEATTSRF
jgi:tetratricopeptide (TPR) repeat protein